MIVEDGSTGQDSTMAGQILLIALQLGQSADQLMDEGYTRMAQLKCVLDKE